MAGKPQYTNRQIIAALTETNGTVYVAAKRLGCHHDTIFRRIKMSPDVAAAVQAARGQRVDRAEMKLDAAVEAGEPWAVALVLKTLGKDRGYVERTETRQVSDDEINDEIRNLLGAVGRNGQAPPPGRPPRLPAP